MHVHRGLTLSAAVTLVATVTGVSVAHEPAPVGTGQVVVVQGLPGVPVEVQIDGRPVGSEVGGGEVLGPFELSADSHVVDFRGPGVDLAATVEVATGSSQDVVLHLPETREGEAVVTTFRTPADPIGAGKARILVAHTASVGAGDVQMDGEEVFAGLTNGEFATAEVPGGRHAAALLPAGSSAAPLLGPQRLDLAARTVTMVYVIGSRFTGFALVRHSGRLADDGSLVPTTIGTGSAGLVSGVRVQPFG